MAIRVATGMGNDTKDRDDPDHVVIMSMQNYEWVRVGSVIFVDPEYIDEFEEKNRV